jgi:hypothetical protein
MAIQGCASTGAAGANGSAKEDPRLREILGADRLRLLELAARAPSTHNSQPWRVRVQAPDEWTIEADPSRRLSAVDSTDRELMLSLGAFLEYLVTGGAALGFDVRIAEAAAGAAPGLFTVKLGRAASGPQGADQVSRIARRRTLRKNYARDPLPQEDLAALTTALGSNARWFPRASPEADWLAQAAVESCQQQTWRDPAQQELARWVRFSDSEARRSADGLTADTMELGWLAGFYMRHFMDTESVTGKTFRESGVDATRVQAGEGAGWLVLGAPDGRDASLIGAGRAFARMALLLRERRIAAHPMSQVLEEDPWRAEVGRKAGVDSPQFVLRIGRVEAYPEPVSLRRSVSAFTSLA